MATALLMASWLLLRPVRKMYLFHLSPVIASATAGSTSKIFLYSSATGSMASATPDDGGAHGDVGLVVRVGGGQQALAQVGLALVVLLDHDELLAVATIMVPPVA
jgi:hypothetical protein